MTTSVIASATAIPVAFPTPTTRPLQLEVVQSQVWTDRDGNVRVNVLLRNPNDFPVQPYSQEGANLLDGTGKLIRSAKLYYLDGISGGSGFFLPGETIAANACFTCETSPLTEKWASVGFDSGISDATGIWNYSSVVEATIASVTFDGDSPIFSVTGTVKNKSNVVLDRIAARIIVFDQKGNLVGAAEMDAENVAPGASANIYNGSGIGLAPVGPVNYKVTALGVKY